MLMLELHSRETKEINQPELLLQSGETSENDLAVISLNSVVLHRDNILHVTTAELNR